jgi:hypothetical protein
MTQYYGVKSSHSNTLYCIFAALSRQHEESQHWHCDSAQLWKACSSCCLTCYTSSRDWSQLWLTGRYSAVLCVWVTLLTHSEILHVNQLSCFKNGFYYPWNRRILILLILFSKLVGFLCLELKFSLSGIH